MRSPRTQPRSRPNKPSSKESETKTFIEHVQELRNRLFWIAVAFILASGMAYPFFDKILAALVEPLGNQQLHYLTPAGGFSFMLKVCMYTGIVAAIPVMIYQLFRYIQPVMGRVRHITLIVYIAASIFLAISGLLLAYFVSLPAALHFLTDFNLPHITAMLTADSYFSFVMTYLLAAAVLFQLPLVLMIINNVTPLNPGSMMKQQRIVIVVAFVLGAVISPTPDALNQALLAGPIVIMYQLGVFLVMAQNYARRRRTRVDSPSPAKIPSVARPVSTRPQPVMQVTPLPSPLPLTPKLRSEPKVFFSDVLAPVPQRRGALRVTPPAPRSVVRPPVRPKDGYARSIDGFAIDA